MAVAVAEANRIAQLVDEAVNAAGDRTIGLASILRRTYRCEACGSTDPAVHGRLCPGAV